jgi:competence protein ComGC
MRRRLGGGMLRNRGCDVDFDAESDLAMSISLRGSLKDFGIADVFQLIGQQRKTGILEFSDRDEKIRLLFDRGAVVSAAPVGQWTYAAFGEMLMRCGLLTRDRVDDLRRDCQASAQTLQSVAIARGWLSLEELRQIEDLLTRETILSVLRWQVGSFDFTAEEVEHDREFDSLLGAEQILMDGLRMVDEWQTFARLVPSESTVFRRALSFEQYRARAAGEPQQQIANAERVLNLIDGRLSVRRVIDLSLLGAFEAVRALAQLHGSQVIETVDSASQPAAREDEPTLASRPSRIRSAAAVAVPLIVLLVVTVLLQVQSGSDTPDAFSIRRLTAFDSSLQAYERQRIRHALEVYRFEHGEWPPSLEALESERLLTREALAAANGRPYYYANRGDGAWLLAPDR